MLNDRQSEKSTESSRRLVLAENYRASPNFVPLTRASVFDAPRRITLDEGQTASREERREIRNSVHEVILKTVR